VNNGVALLTPQEQLQVRLADPKTVDSLNRLLDQVDLIAFSFEALDGFLRRSEVVAASLTASITDLRSLTKDGDSSGIVEALPKLARTGVQLAGATATPEFQNLMSSGLIEQLGNPKTIEALKMLLSKMEVAAFALEAVDSFVRRGDEITDSIADSIGELKNAATDIDIDQLKTLAAKVPALVDTGAKLVDAGLFDQKVLDALSEAGQAVAESYEHMKTEPAKPLGIFGLLRALKDPDVSRSLNFLLDVAKRYSQKMK
jgi:uncharacterized protein YjgD (DUF1641 family)